MAKLYPPSIEGKLPAFAGGTLRVPLTMNRSVKKDEVFGMRALVKTVQTGQIKATLIGSLTKDSVTGKYYGAFDLKDFKPDIGQYYKIQIAYVGENDKIGYYSTVGVAKYTTVPNLTIPGLEKNFYGKYTYLGEYSQEGKDTTEKVYSYCFELTDRDGNIVSTSGVKIHDASSDNSNTAISTDSWTLRRNLVKDVPYYIQYKVTTINGLEVSSAKYLVMEQDSVDIDTKLTLLTEVDYDNGGILLSFHPESDTSHAAVVNGSFVLVRSSSQDDFETWDEIYRFTYSYVNMEVGVPVPLWKDYSIQQGVEYVYALQGYNSYGLYSNRILSVNKNDRNKTGITADFEDIFLYDGERQLKIRFNPKVSNFKETVLENKMDTIGSQFPFVMRNGYVKYKEFPIAGLITLQNDPDELFLKGIQSEDFITRRELTPSTQQPTGELDNYVSSSNIQRERDFKIAVLEWLNNGKPKLFKSPTEGNYIVRLMNVSMTPNDTLGRMLHNFNCQAYEIAEYTFNNLVSLGLTILPESKTTRLKIGQIPLHTVSTMNKENLIKYYPDFQVQDDGTINLPSVSMANITEATPGTRLGLSFANSQGEVLIEIGDTGSYYVLINEYPLIAIRLIKGSWDDAKLTFNYVSNEPSDMFSSVSELILTDEIRQIIGNDFNTNIIVGLEDIKRDIGQFHYIKVVKRQIEKIWKINGSYYRTNIGLDKVDKWDRTMIYYVVNTGEYLDGSANKKIKNKIDYRFAVNPKEPNDYIDMGGRENPYPTNCTKCEWEGDETPVCPKCGADTETKFGDTFGRVEAIRNIEKVNSLYIGNGVIVDIAYRVRTKNYVVEDKNEEVCSVKQNWMNMKTKLEECIAHPYSTQDDYEKEVEKVEAAYKTYINKLKDVLLREGNNI